MNLRWQILTAIVALGLASPVGAGTLRFSGSTTFNAQIMVPHRAAIEKALGQALVVVPNKSSDGLIALLNGQADFAMISTALPDEVALLRDYEAELPLNRLREFEIWHTRMAFAVHRTNPIHSLKATALRRILLGEISNWRDLGGPDRPITVVLVKTGGGVELSVRTQLLDGKPIGAPNTIHVQGSSDLPLVVRRDPGALGLSQLGIVASNNLQELVIDRPIEQRLSLVTLGEPTPEMRELIGEIRRICWDD
jgi:phosphate transport system substrate-binding protein